MNLQTIYKAIKQRIGGTTPKFQYTGQYNKGKDKLSLIAPAIYIEMPSNENEVQYSRKTTTLRNPIVKVHVVNNAPFAGADGTVQDASIAAHEQKVMDIDKLLVGFEIKDNEDRLIAAQLRLVKIKANQFAEGKIITVLTYSSNEWHSYHLV